MSNTMTTLGLDLQDPLRVSTLSTLRTRPWCPGWPGCRRRSGWWRREWWCLSSLGPRWPRSWWPRRGWSSNTAWTLAPGDSRLGQPQGENFCHRVSRFCNFCQVQSFNTLQWQSPQLCWQIGQVCPSGHSERGSQTGGKLKYYYSCSFIQIHSNFQLNSMQKMLEETLLKNLHLQQDLEAMSQEVVRLSKLASSSSWYTNIFKISGYRNLLCEN